jgi:hypothetical protein
MSENQNATILVTMPRPYRDLLRKMAAERNLVTPEKVVTAAGLCREIVCMYFDKLISEGEENVLDISTDKPCPRCQEEEQNI